MKYRCTHCGLSSFAAEDARCPQCLRRGGLVDADAPDPRHARHWGRIALLTVILATMGFLPVYGTWDLSERAASRSWPSTVARVTKSSTRRLRCDVDYAFVVGANSYSGQTERVACPGPGDPLTVSYDPEEPSRHRAESGLAVFIDLFGIGFGLVGVVTLGGVWLYLLFPRVDSLRRFAAWAGSKDARAASLAPAPTVRR